MRYGKIGREMLRHPDPQLMQRFTLYGLCLERDAKLGLIAGSAQKTTRNSRNFQGQAAP